MDHVIQVLKAIVDLMCVDYDFSFYFLTHISFFFFTVSSTF